MNKEEGKKPEQVLWLEEQLGFELNEVELSQQLEKMMSYREKNSFSLDKDNNILGINLAANNLKNANFLSAFPSLIYINLQHNLLSEICFIKNITNLRWLNINFNKIRNIESITKHRELSIFQAAQNEIDSLSPLSYLTNLEEINVSSNIIKEVFDFSKLKKLKSLIIDGCYREKELIISKQNLSLSNLIRLSLGNNAITNFSFLQETLELEFLRLSGVYIYDLSFLESMKHLNFLDLSYCIFFSDMIKLPKSLKILYLRKCRAFNGFDNSMKTRESYYKNNLALFQMDTAFEKTKINKGIIHDLSFIKQATNLKELDISDNILSDYTCLSSLSIKSLHASNTNITNLKFINDIKSLEVIELSKNGISVLPDISQSNIDTLMLSENEIVDISPIAKMKKIKNLWISDNKVKDIKPLIGLPNLKSLDLSYNLIKDSYSIKQFLLESHSIKDLSLNGNPIDYIPIELISAEDLDEDNCLPHLRNYYQNQTFVPNKEIKVVILGNGMVGKSTLLNRFLSPDGDWKDIKIAISDRTEGIVIKENIDFELADDKQIKLNIWDFGGQEVYHGTHRLFLNKDAVYIIVWALETDEQKEEIRQNLNYWLDYVQDLAIDSPVILVHSQCDKESEKNRKEISKQLDISEEPKYANNIIENDLSFSAKTGEGLNELKNAIKKAITTKLSARVETEIPEKWSLLRDDLRKLRENENNKKNEISYQDYIDKCKKREIEQSEAETVLLFLHRTGFLYYDQNLSKNIILNQTWAIEAIYEALKPKSIAKKSKGVLEYEDLKDFWLHKNYTETEVKTFIDFMVSSEICFCKEQQDYRDLENPTFIVPHYLEEPNPLLIEWDKPNSFYMIYKPAFFHKGIAERFLSRLGRLSGQNALWKDGILLKSDIFSSKALITFDREKGNVTISSENNELLEAILKELNKILDEGSQTKPSEKVTFFYSLDGKEFVEKEELLKGKELNSDFVFTTEQKKVDLKPILEKYNFGSTQKTVSKESDYENEGKQNETLLIKEANNKKNTKEINPFVAAALKALENANYADYFEEMDNVEIPIESKAIYQELKMKMITGNAPFNFEQSLRLFAKEIDKKL